MVRRVDSCAAAIVLECFSLFGFVGQGTEPLQFVSRAKSAAGSDLFIKTFPIGGALSNPVQVRFSRLKRWCRESRTWSYFSQVLSAGVSSRKLVPDLDHRIQE